MGALTLLDYRTAVQGCGVPEMDSDILNPIINQAQIEVIGDRLWSFRLTDESISSTETITNLGIIDGAVDADGFVLMSKDKAELQAWGYNLADTGTPLYYYTDTDNLVASYPLGNFTLRHFAKPTAMSSDGDTSLLPDECQLALTYRAASHAFARVGIREMQSMYYDMSVGAMNAMGQSYGAYFEDPSRPLQYEASE